MLIIKIIHYKSAKRKQITKIFAAEYKYPRKLRRGIASRGNGGDNVNRYNIAVVGATGMVGRKFLTVLAQRKVPIDNLYLFASARSAGSSMDFCGKSYVVRELTPENVLKLTNMMDYALFSAGAAVSKVYAPLFVEAGATVVDNSSQWRMSEGVPLVVPEVNPEDAFCESGIIANPNCSTIQAVAALAPLEKEFGIERVVYSTYQAVSGAGMGGYNDLIDGVKGLPPRKFPHPIAYNILPHIDVFMEDGYTKEEWKMIVETRKILHRPDLRVTATTARVPVFYGHCESINVQLKAPCSAQRARQLLMGAKGVEVADDPASNVYPLPIFAEGRDEVFVGRIREDVSAPNALNMWVVADNIRKGAATNAVQIVELLISRKEAKGDV